MKVVDINQYATMLRELVEEGKEVSLGISGNSMYPFLLQHRDQIIFKKPWRKPVRGDIVFYQRPTGQYVCHRVYKVKEEGYYIIGDAQTEVEGPLPQECIWAIVTKVCRKGKWLTPEDFLWKFYARFWLGIIPLRPFVRKSYSIVTWPIRKIRRK